MSEAGELYKKALIAILKFPDPCDQAKLIMKAAQLAIDLGKVVESNE